VIVAALFAVYVIWGSTYLVMRIGLETIPPFMMGGSRFLIAGVLLFGFLRVRGAPSPSAKEWGAAVKVGVLLLVAGNGFIALAEQRVSSSVATSAARGERRANARRGEWKRLPATRLQNCAEGA
jgi:drug/metabolite transporter (DMT)-like permease